MGLNSLGAEIAKNIVLSGVKQFTIFDNYVKVENNHCNGQFFVNEDDVGKERAQVSLIKIQQLNQYVKVDLLNASPLVEYQPEVAAIEKMFS